jgi:hypothetical protein
VVNYVNVSGTPLYSSETGRQTTLRHIVNDIEGCYDNVNFPSAVNFLMEDQRELSVLQTTQQGSLIDYREVNTCIKTVTLFVHDTGESCVPWYSQLE